MVGEFGIVFFFFRGGGGVYFGPGIFLFEGPGILGGSYNYLPPFDLPCHLKSGVPPPGLVRLPAAE